MEKTRLHIPLIFGLDVIHGDHTVFPVPLAVAASFDPSAAEIVAHTGGVEARADGVPWVFSPMVDISRDPRWGRIIESNGEDPYLGSVMARAWVRGYQQGDLSKPDSVAVSVKHFAAYGAAIAGRDYNETDMSEIKLRQVYLEPYRAAVAEGAATLMSSFNSINGVPASANPFTLTQILRKEWGFDGFVVSDWGSVVELINHSIGDGPTVARKALEAGVDMDMEGNLYGTVIAQQVRSGKIPESVIDEAVRRILRVKFALGLFEHPYVEAGPAYEPTPEKRALTRKVAGETLVLLKNDPVEGVGALLPMTGKAKKVALIGPMADNPRDILGAWTGGDPKFAITLRKALSERLGENLLYAEGCGLLSGQDAVTLNKVNFGGSVAAAVGSNEIPDDDKTIAQAVETAKQADVAILALGESANWMEGEASSRVHLGFTGNQQKLLEAVAATGKPVILVVMAGRPLELKWAAEHVPAILEAWSPGMEGGHAIADVLFGDVNPSGKLPASLPRAVGQEPLYYAQMPTGRPAGERRPEQDADRFADEIPVALRGRGELGAVPVRLGPELHALQLFEAHGEPRDGAAQGSAGLGSHAGGQGSLRGEEHGLGGRDRSGADVYPQHQRQRGAAGARVEGIRARPACAGRVKTRGVAAGLRRTQLLQRGSEAHRGADYLQNLGRRQFAGNRGDEPANRRVREQAIRE